MNSVTFGTTGKGKIMHTYSTDNELRPRVYWALSLISYFGASAVGALIVFASRNLPLAIGAGVSTGVVFKVILKIYNKWLWNTAPAKLVGATSVPDLNGEWSGWLKTSYEGDIDDEALHPENEPEDDLQALSATLHIEQTWREINIHLETENSSSDSNGATILTKEGRWPSINYQYQNAGSENPNDSMKTHDGTADLEIKEDNEGRCVLEGVYYTGPGRENRGKMRFVRNESA